jgi:hypothetical protein
MKALAIIAIALFALGVFAFTTGDLQVYEDGSCTYQADVPFSPAWRD